MIKVTNKLNLPTPFVKMAESDYQYREGRYSVTALLKGIRETMLERRHTVEVDVSDRIWLLFGTAVHNILESQEEEDHQLKEASIETEIDGITISGRFDLYDGKTKTITDYKTCSAWKIVFGDFDDWKKQLLCYAYIMKELGFEVKRGEVVAMIRDHSKRDAKYKKDYPKLPVQRILFDFTKEDFHEIEEFLKDKVAEIKVCEKLADDDLPICTPEQRFNSGDKFAVMKKNRKRAMRVLDSQEAAEEWKESNGGDFIEVRKAEDKKCLDYCSVNTKCSYYKTLVAE